MTNGAEAADAKSRGKDGAAFALNLETLAIHAGQDPKQWSSRDVIPPISVTTTFARTTVDDMSSFHYSRMDNPTRRCLEACLAQLEKAKFATCYASGLAAVDAVLHLFKSGGHIVASHDIYGGVNRLLRNFAIPFGFEVDFVDASNIDNIAKVLKANTTLVWVETPTNPLMKIVDIAGVATALKTNAPQAKFVVDNSFMSPYFQNPLALGADIVMHSATKYLNGHSDALMGCLMMNNEDLHNRLCLIQTTAGSTPSPFDCFLVLRGVKTLAVRMERHQENGLKVARYLQKHPQVEKVLHPGLTSHPQHDTAKMQSSGFSGMLSFYMKGGAAASRVLLSSLKVFALAESLGSVESLASYPIAMSHASVPPEQRAKMGVTDTLIRLSIGLENIDDLIKDLEQAFQAAAKAAATP